MTLSVLCVLFSTKNNIYDNILKTTGIEVLCESEIMPPHLIFDVMLKWNYIKLKTIYIYIIVTPSLYFSNVLCKHIIVRIQIFADNRPW